MKRTKILDRTMLAYAAVTFVCWLIGTGLMFLLYNKAGFGYWSSSICNYLVSGTLNYVLQSRYTFHSEEKQSWILAKYVLHMVLCYLAAYSLVPYESGLLAQDFGIQIAGNVSLAAGSVLFTVLNYFGQRYVVFHDFHKKSKQAEA